MSNFPKRLKELRKEKGLNQEQLGEIIGVAKQTISSYEKGNSFPNIIILTKFCDYFNVSISYITGQIDINWPFEEKEKSIIEKEFPELTDVLRKYKNPTLKQRELGARLLEVLQKRSRKPTVSIVG